MKTCMAKASVGHNMPEYGSLQVAILEHTSGVGLSSVLFLEAYYNSVESCQVNGVQWHTGVGWHGTLCYKRCKITGMVEEDSLTGLLIEW